MNGASFDIAISAQSLGVDSSAEQLNALASRIKQVDTVATAFDSSVSAAARALADSANAARAAASALSAAEKKYSELESAANSAAKALEKATAAGKDTSELAAAAGAARAAMAAQASVVDDLRAKADAAAAAQSKLADSLGTLKGAQSSEVAAIKKRTDAQEESTKGTEVSIAAYITIARQIWRVVKAVYAAGKAFFEFLVAQDPAAVARLTTAYDKLKAGVKSLFTGLKFDKFVGGLEKVMSLFNEGTSSARGMKALVETILQPLLDGIGKIAPYVKAFFEGMIHGALLVVIAVLKLRNAIFAAMSPETRAYIKQMIDKVFTLENAFAAGKYVAIALAVALAALVVVFLACGLALALMIAPIIAVIAAIQNWGAITAWLKAKWQAFKDWLTGLWDETIGAALAFGKNIATNIIAGLTGGLAAKSPQVTSSINNVLKAAQAGAATTLDSHSPSRVYEKMGGTIPQGLAGGVEGGASEVKGALETMVSPIDGPSGGGSTFSSSSSSSTSSSSAKATVNFYGPVTIGDSPVAKTNWVEAEAMFLRFIEGASLTIGGGEVPA